MSPSRGINTLLRARLQTNILQCGRRYSNFVRAATNPENKSQIYISRTDDPYINLSIEHYLLQKTPADSTVLFLYTNRPCVIIGRNQNPWVETNLGMLRNSGLNADLVRRRSGGGTVWHDEGNINYSVICPTSNFHRDKHAEMVVRALRKLGLNQVRVNERHDIVYNKTIDVEISPKDQRLGDTGQEGGLIEKTFKISGSAYKLTRLRSLHHGTCIAWSRNINAFSRYLRSPAKSLIVARGVESVSSPVTNLEKDPVQVEEAVVSEFSTMYEAGEPLIVTDAEAAVPEIAAGLKELTSNEWIYSQTPQFTFSTEGVENAWESPEEFKATFTARHGQISEISLDYGDTVPHAEMEVLASSLQGRQLHEITDWVTAFRQQRLTLDHKSIPAAVLSPLQKAGAAMNRLLGTGNHMLREYIRPWGLGLKDYVELCYNGSSSDKDAQLLKEYHNIYPSDMPGYTDAYRRHAEGVKERMK